MIVTIDGPAGSGKSSTARAVAARLGFRHLESGAFYRGLTVAALRTGIDPHLSEALRDPEVNKSVSRMARLPAVRTWLLDSLRAAARGVDLVADGRDMGTVV